MVRESFAGEPCFIFFSSFLRVFFFKRELSCRFTVENRLCDWSTVRILPVGVCVALLYIPALNWSCSVAYALVPGDSNLLLC